MYSHKKSRGNKTTAAHDCYWQTWGAFRHALKSRPFPEVVHSSCMCVGPWVKCLENVSEPTWEHKREMPVNFMTFLTLDRPITKKTKVYQYLRMEQRCHSCRRWRCQLGKTTRLESFWRQKTMFFIAEFIHYVVPPASSNTAPPLTWIVQNIFLLTCLTNDLLLRRICQRESPKLNNPNFPDIFPEFVSESDLSARY